MSNYRMDKCAVNGAEGWRCVDRRNGARAVHVHQALGDPRWLEIAFVGDLHPIDMPESDARLLVRALSKYLEGREEA